MVGVHIREFTPADYAACIAVHNAAYPEYPETVEGWRFHDANRDPKCRWKRFVAEGDAGIIGFGGFSQSAGMYHPRKFTVEAVVRPDAEGRGVGGALYDATIGALAEFDPLTLYSEYREDKEPARRFAAARGFTESMREQESQLDLSAFDPSRFAGESEAAEAKGYRLLTAAEAERVYPDARRKLFELHWQVTQDVPHPDVQTRPEFDVWIKRFDYPDYLPEGNWIAVEESTGEYVGVSLVWKSGESPDLDTGLTGVLRAHRGKGLATALKLKVLTWAKESGWASVRTTNEVNNAGMLGINRRLGFEKRPAWVHLIRVLKEEE